MSLLRQGRHFILVGVAQVVVDWGVTVALSHSGIDLAVANITGRVTGALLGFTLNGQITFAGEDGGRAGWRQFGRYLLWWLATTALSTVGVIAIEARLGLGWAWLGKPLVDGLLAVLGFIASRQWVYR